MENQICSKCKLKKPLDDFSKGNNKIGLQYKCNSCVKEYREVNRDKILKRQKEYRNRNKEVIRKKDNEYAKRNRKKKKDYDKKYRKENKNKIKLYREKYKKENPDKVKESNRKHKSKNRKAINKYYREKTKTDPLFKLKKNLRNRVRFVILNKKGKKTEKILGTSFEEVKTHIESTFTDGMSWENYGACKDSNCNEVWHIDHKIPLASATTEDELLKLCHYTNLQALWAIDNLTKNKY